MADIPKEVVQEVAKVVPGEEEQGEQDEAPPSVETKTQKEKESPGVKATLSQFVTYSWRVNCWSTEKPCYSREAFWLSGG